MATRIAALSRFGHSANDIYWFVLPTVLPLMLREFGFSYTAAGGFVTSFLCVIAVVSFLAGRLADRVSRTALLSGGFYLASFALMAAGAVTSLPWFVAFVVFAGIGVSTFHPVMYAVIDESRDNRRGTMFACFELFGAVGVVSLLALNGLFGERLGFRSIVMLACIPGLAAGTLFSFCRKSVDNTQLLEKPREEVPRPAFAGAGPFAHAAELASGVGSSALMAGFFASIILRTLTSTAIMNFMPTYLALGAGLDASLGTLAAGLLFVGAIIINLFSGGLVDRYGADKLLLVSSLAAGALLVLTTYTASIATLPVTLITLGAAISAAIPAQNLMLSSLSPAGKKGTVFGTLMGIMTIANSIGPLLLGLVADRIGLSATFRLASLPVLLSCVLVVFVARKRRIAQLKAKQQKPAVLDMSNSP